MPETRPVIVNEKMSMEAVESIQLELREWTDGAEKINESLEVISGTIGSILGSVEEIIERTSKMLGNKNE